MNALLRKLARKTGSDPQAVIYGLFAIGISLSAVSMIQIAML